MKRYKNLTIVKGVAILLGTLPLISIGWQCRIWREPEIHLIPSGYRGPVAIGYDKEKGLAAKYENGVRVYEIPPDGIFRSQFDTPYDGWARKGTIRYFYVDESGRRQEIPEVLRREDMTDSTKVYVFGSAGNLAKPNGFEMYVVGTLKECTDSVFTLMHNMARKAVVNDTTAWNREIYLIPAGYRGPVVVILDQRDGNAARYEGSTRVYEIGPDGVLRAQMETKSVLPSKSIRYFYVDKWNRRVEIPVAGWRENMTDEKQEYIFKEESRSTNVSSVTSYIVGTVADYTDSVLRAQKQMIEREWGEE